MSKHNARNDYGAGHPPVPLQLAKKIETEVFIEMVDLLPERLGDKEKGCHRSKHSKRSLSILEWVQRFSTYIAVVAKKHPEYITDLMGYQSIIIHASLEYKGDCRAGYD